MSAVENGWTKQAHFDVSGETYTFNPAGDNAGHLCGNMTRNPYMWQVRCLNSSAVGLALLLETVDEDGGICQVDGYDTAAVGALKGVEGTIITRNPLLKATVTSGGAVDALVKVKCWAGERDQFPGGYGTAVEAA